MAPRGVAIRTVASVLGIRHTPAAAARPGPRPRGGHSLARRCVAAVLGVPLPPAAEPAASAPRPWHVVHGWTELEPGDSPVSPLDLLGPPRPPVREPRRRLTARPVLLLVAASVAAGLLSWGMLRPDGGAGHVTPASPGALFHLLPENIRRAGKITVGTADQAPMVSLSSGTTTGLDPDLLRALGRELGVEVHFDVTDRSSLVQDVLDGNVDVAAAGLSVTASRRQYVEFVEYLIVGSVVTVPADNPGHIRSVADLCGRRVAVVAGSIDAASLTARDCAGHPVQTMIYNTPGRALGSVGTGEADASFTDFPSADYATGQPGSHITVIGRQTDPGPYGLAVSKHDPQLRQALTAALDALIDDGTYRRILGKYHLTSGAISPARVDGGE